MRTQWALGGRAWQCVFAAQFVFLWAAQSGESKPAEPLPAVVVTAPSPGDAPPPEAPKLPSASPTRQTAGGADIVRVQKFIEGRTGNPVDLFEGTPGLFIQSENGAQFSRVSIRGSGIETEASGLQYLIDGIPINQGDGVALLEDVDLLAVKSVDVYRGSNALRYGALRLGGAINFLSKTGYDVCGHGVGLRFEAGSFVYYSESGSYGGVRGSTDYFASFQDIQSDGYRKHSAEDSQKFFGDAGFKLGCNAENRVFLSFGHLDREDPGGLTRDQIRATPTHANDDAIAMDFHQHWETVRLADKLTFKLDCDQSFSAAAFYQYRILTDKELYEVDNPVGIKRYHSHDTGLVFSYENLANLACHQNRLTLGFTPTLQFKSDANYQNLDGVQGPQIDGDRTLASNYVLFGEDQFHITDNLSAIGGLQLIRSHRNFLDTFHPSGVADRTRGQDFNGVNPKLGLLYEICGKDQVFGNFSRSFQPPSFDDLVSVQSADGFLYHHLHAQIGNTVEVGGRGEHDRVEWEFSAYRAWLRNELLSLKNAQGVSVGAVNAGSTFHQGIEAGVDVDLWRGIAAQACNGATKADRIVLRQSYTLSDFHFENDRSFGDNRIAAIPRHLYFGRLEYRHPVGFYAGPGLEWNVTRYPVDHANTLFAEPYALLNFRAGYESCSGFTVFFEAKNLTNKTYASAVETQSDARQGGPPDAFKPGNGRAFYGGFSMKW